MKGGSCVQKFLQQSVDEKAFENDASNFYGVVILF